MELTERTRGDWISLQLCRAVAARLRKEPDLIMRILFDNLERMGRAIGWTENEEEWWGILESHTPEQIADILEAETDESQRLRSNFRGQNVLAESLRRQIIRSAYGLEPFSEAFIHAA